MKVEGAERDVVQRALVAKLKQATDLLRDCYAMAEDLELDVLRDGIADVGQTLKKARELQAQAR